jgi:hypothetical protein
MGIQAGLSIDFTLVNASNVAGGAPVCTFSGEEFRLLPIMSFENSIHSLTDNTANHQTF